MAWIRCIGDSGGSFAPTSNLWGGPQMAIDILKAGLSSASAANDYVSLTGSYAMNNRVVVDDIFEANKRYTFILAFANNSTYSGGSVTANLLFRYSDDSYDTLTITGGQANTKYTRAFVSAEGKTVSSIQCTYNWETAKLYYEESGVFEGVKTVDDFEPYYSSSTTLLTEGMISTDSGPVEAFYDKDGSSYEYLAVKVWMNYNDNRPWGVALVPTSTIPESGYRNYTVMLHNDDGSGVVSQFEFAVSKTSIKVVTYTTRLWYYCYADVAGIPNNELF